MTVFEIPLTAEAQAFSIALSGTTYELTLVYRPGVGWVLDIADANGNSLVNGLPLVTGGDLLAQHRHLGFAGGLWVQGAANPDDVPTFDDLGVGSHVFWVTD